MNSCFTYKLIPLLISIFITSCSEHPCASPDLQYRLIGFSDADVDTIILRRFTKGTPNQIDSFVFDPGNPIRFNRFGDTLIMSSFLSTALIQSVNDYQFFFPGASKTITVTEINEEKTNGRRKGDLICVNPVTTCKIDGIVSPVHFAFFIYLRR